MRTHANCFACGAKIDLTDDESYSLARIPGSTRTRTICADIDCEVLLARGPEPEDDTPSLDTSFDDHELMRHEPLRSPLFHGTVAEFEQAVESGLTISLAGLSKALQQEAR
jgi:hypothetical protein